MIFCLWSPFLVMSCHKLVYRISELYTTCSFVCNSGHPTIHSSPKEVHMKTTLIFWGPQGHVENWAKSICTSFGEECTCSVFLYFLENYSNQPILPLNLLWISYIECTKAGELQFLLNYSFLYVSVRKFSSAWWQIETLILFSHDLNTNYTLRL